MHHLWFRNCPVTNTITSLTSVKPLQSKIPDKTIVYVQSLHPGEKSWIGLFLSGSWDWFLSLEHKSHQWPWWDSNPRLIDHELQALSTEPRLLLRANSQIHVYFVALARHKNQYNPAIYKCCANNWSDTYCYLQK